MALISTRAKWRSSPSGWSGVEKKYLTQPALSEMPYNALPVDVASGSCPEVRFWSITLLARSLCGTCPRSRFLGSFKDHFDALPTIRPNGFASDRRPGRSAGVCYAKVMAATGIRRWSPESPRFRELGNSRRIHARNNVSRQVLLSNRNMPADSRSSVNAAPLQRTNRRYGTKTPLAHSP